MKNMRKLFAMVLAVIMVMSLATTAFAASITIEGGASGSEYAAYKLLNATNATTAEGKEIYAYTLNQKYADVLKQVTGKTTEAEIVAYIGAIADQSAAAQDFADAVYAAIKAAAPAISADYTTASDNFANVDQGYYLIAETKVGDTTDTFSLVMLDTAGEDSITVTTKEDKPTVEKKVEEKNDSTSDDPTWGDSADYDVGDSINYTITGTVSSKYADYKSYDYKFTDTMDAGLTYNKDAKVYVVNGTTETEVTSQFTITNLDNGFTAYADLTKLAGVEISATTTIVVKYSATLNENAVSGTTGNKNTVVLEYENDPYVESDGKPGGKTPEDTNIVFTYDVVVDKVDSDQKPLTGAGFTLYKWDAETNAWVAVGTEVKGDAMTTFNFNKLDEGKYKLVETTVPAGYNKAADVEFEITSTLEGTTLTSLTVTPAEKFTVTLDSGKIETDIVNNAGTELPSTGGVGTTMFYVIGGILMLAAVVLLVTKKRMASAE